MLSRRIRVQRGSDGFLGGFPPSGVEPHGANLKFLATVRCAAEDQWLSVFVVDDYWELQNSLRLGRIVELPPTIEVIQHRGVLRRTRSSEFRSVLSSHTLRVDAPADDQVDGEPLVESKMGGQPAYALMSAEIREMLESTRRSGFEHVLQFSFGSGPDEEEVAGNWPFGDRVVSFFSRASGARTGWRVFWRGF